MLVCGILVAIAALCFQSAIGRAYFEDESEAITESVVLRQLRQQERRARSANEDYLVNGMKCSLIPGFCFHELGQILCQHFCMTSEGITLPPPSCRDHVHLDATCDELTPKICGDEFGKQLCCQSCLSQGLITLATTPQPTVTPEPHTTPRPHLFECRNHLTHPILKCSLISNVCADQIGMVVCKGFCDNCTEVPDLPEPSHDPTGCEDVIGNGLSCQEIPGVCANTYALLFCPKYCGLCPTTTTTAATTRALPDCADSVGNGLECSMLPGVCDSVFNEILCKDFCGFCGPTTPPEATVSPPADTTSLTTEAATTSSVTVGTTPHKLPCRDSVYDDLTCHRLSVAGFCDTFYAGFVCRKSCGFCGEKGHHHTPQALTTTTVTPSTLATAGSTSVSPTILATATTTTEATTTVATTTTAPRPAYCAHAPTISLDCADKTEWDVCNLPGACDDTYAQLVCAATCSLCQPCADQVDPHFTCAELQQMTGRDKAGFCSDPLAHRACIKHCECC